VDPQNPPQPAHYADDEIDLFELFKSLWKEKVLIVGTTFVITLLRGGYAFLAKPTYEVSVKLNPQASEAAQIQPGDVPDTYADVTDLVKESDYKPNTSIKDGIANFAKWFTEFYG